MRPLKQQAYLQAHDLTQEHKVVGAGHRFGKASIFAIMPGNVHPEKLKWTSNADQLMFNKRLVQINMNLIGGAIVAFVRSWLGNFCKSQPLQTVQTHTIQCQKSSWHREISSCASSCGRVYKSQYWHTLRVVFKAGCSLS